MIYDLKIDTTATTPLRTLTKFVMLSVFSQP